MPQPIIVGASHGLLMNYDAVFSTKIGKLGIVTEHSVLCSIAFLPDSKPLQKPVHAFATLVCDSLMAYFANPQYQFDLPLKNANTPFKQRVYAALRNIPLGETVTYGDLAKQLSSHPRAIGQACRRNPIPIIVPCHRVLAKQNLGGFSGGTGVWLPIKTALLEHEGFVCPF